jgi:hypothetical protein
VEEYTPLLASTIANETRLKTASEFGPIKELKGFKKVFPQPGDSRRVTLELEGRLFVFFNTTKHLWVAEPALNAWIKVAPVFPKCGGKLIYPDL